jgi:putative membrane protein insertion efficiency factor
MAAESTAGAEPQPNRSALAWLMIALIRLYQRCFSRFLPPACRFEPSCSRYAVASLEARGALRGSLLSIVRLCKCHPFHPGGYDPPPTRALELGGPEAR